MLPAEATAPVDPYAVFAQTRADVSAARYPNRLDYTIHVSGFDGSVFRANHYRANDRADRGLNVAAMSEEEAHSWHVPQGIDVKFEALIYGAAIVVPLGRTPASLDLLGVPILTPAYTFGIKYPTVTVATAHGTPSPAMLPVIAVVSSQERDYRIEYEGAVPIDGVETYDLRLTPLRDPKQHRIRELWVDVDDHFPRRAKVAGNFTLAPLTDVPWTIDFTVYDGAPYIEDERADATLYMPHRQVVREASIAFEDLHEGDGFMNVPLIAPDETGTSLEEPGS